jgi:SAM-dependent methyltransferase
VGCGKAEMLIRLVARTRARALGLDLNPGFLDEARSEAGRRIPDGRLELRLADASELDEPPGSFALALCVGSSHALGGLDRALAALVDWVRAGGHVMVGEGHWSREPAPEYLAAIDAARDELLDRAATEHRMTAAGLSVIATAEATLDDWDAYELPYARAVEEWVAAHPEDPDAPAMIRRIRNWQDAYRRWGRGTMGFALYLLSKP